MSIRPDNRHLYLQVIDQIKKDIEEGVYKEGEKLPSEFHLSKMLGISRATLREALRVLDEENVVTRRHGVGTFVNSRPMFSSGIEELYSVTNMIERIGMVAGSRYLSAEVVTANDEDKKRFHPLEFDEVSVVERVRTADATPVVYCIDRFPAHLVSIHDIHKSDSFFKVIEEEAHKRISYAVTYIEPIGFHETISPILNCGVDQPLLLLKQLHFTEEDEPILYSSNYFRADKFSFHVLRKRV
ncbi:GntR family transcriptional regulator [Bacillaceae bacterium S4-13-56]